MMTTSGFTLTDPDDIAAYTAGRLTIITVHGGVAGIAEHPPKDRVLILDYDECDAGSDADYCTED